MATSRKPAAGGAAKKNKGGSKNLMSPKTAAQFALNDLLGLHADDTETPEVVNGRKVLADHGFEIRPSRQVEIQKIKDEMAAIDTSEAGAGARMVELGKRLGAAQRGKVIAAKKKVE